MAMRTLWRSYALRNGIPLRNFFGNAVNRVERASRRLKSLFRFDSNKATR